MGKTLKNIIACTLIGGSLLFSGCGKNEKYVLLNSRGWIVGEYDTKEEAEEMGKFNYRNIPFKVIEKSKIEEKKETPNKENFTARRPYYSAPEENPVTPEKTYRSIHQLKRAQQSKINLPFNLEEIIFKCLPGKMLKDITFKKIDEERSFNGKSYEDYILNCKNGYVFYDLDKDRSLDVAAKFDNGRNFPATEVLVSEIKGKKEMTLEGKKITLAKGTLNEIIYGDIDRDEILEMKIELKYDTSGQVQHISRRDLSAY